MDAAGVRQIIIASHWYFSPSLEVNRRLQVSGVTGSAKGKIELLSIFCGPEEGRKKETGSVITTYKHGTA